jgi:hypothetical protein
MHLMQWAILIQGIWSVNQTILKLNFYAFPPSHKLFQTKGI